MSIEFYLKYDFSKASGFVDHGNYGVVRIDNGNYRVNWSKFYHLSSSIKKQISFDKLNSQQLITITDGKSLSNTNFYQIIFNYIDGEQIKIDYSNYFEINSLANYFGISNICEISTPLTIFFQQVKSLRKQISVETPEMIHILALLFPLIERLPITVSIFDLIKIKVIVQILEDSMLYPISDDLKITVLFNSIKPNADNSLILNYMLRNHFSISEILFIDLEEKMKTFPEKLTQTFFQNIKIGLKGTGKTANEQISKIKEKEFYGCWNNFVSNLSQTQCYYPPDKEKDKKHHQITSTPFYQTMSNASSIDFLDQIPIEETPTESPQENHFSTEFLDPNKKHYILINDI